MPPQSVLSAVDKSSSCIIPAEPQLPIEPVKEFNEGVTHSENPSRSDVMLKAQRRLSFECIDGCLDHTEEMYPSILHLEDREQADVNFTRRDAASCKLEQNESKQHDEITSENSKDTLAITSGDSKDLFADTYNESREPIKYQNEITRCHGFSSQLPHQPLSGLQVSDHYHTNTTALVKKPVTKLMLSDFKASAEKHGMLRRCFRFGNNLNYSKRLHSNVSGSSLQQVPIQVEAPTKLTMDSYQSARFSFSSYAGKSPNINILKRTGIGLHLNSIVKTLPAPTPNHREMHDASIKPLKLANIKQPHVEQRETKIVNRIHPQIVNKIHGNEGSAGTKSNHLSSHGANKILLHTDNRTGSHHDKRKSRSKQQDLFDELKESGSKRERTGSDAKEGCSRCNCKRTKCSKLYCDCFAAGIYCGGSCSCQDCSNKHEFQDIVRETRLQIMSRNPLAFSSKVTENLSERLPNNADIIPSASRHKRGCKCKKSMCVKKYCECYQGDVWCSDDCHCQGCKNIYGKNTGCGYDEFQKISLSRTVQGFGGAYGENLEADIKKTIISRTDFSNLQYHEFMTASLHPPQVSVSLSDHLPIASFSLPDSSMMSCNEKPSKPPSTTDINDMLLTTSSNSSHQMPHEWESDSISSERMTVLQPSYDADKYSHSQRNSPSEFAMGANFSASAGSRVLKNAFDAQLSQDGRLSLAEWSQSPIRLGQSRKTKSHPGNDYGCNLSDKTEDKPGILEYSTLVNAVNVRSPNRRQVTHHKPLLALHNPGSGSTYILTRARKYILKSVPTLQTLAKDNNLKKNTGSELGCKI